MIITENNKLLIRELTKSDLKVVFELYSDKEAMKFRGSIPFENINEAIEMLDKVAGNIKNQTEYRYAIIEKTTNELIGTYLFTPITNKNCMVGCSIGKKYWRLGYGIEVMLLMTEYLMKLNFEKLIGLIKKDNIPSIKLIEKLNYTLIKQTDRPEFYKYEKIIRQ